jgi:hypothetical protein
MCWSPLVSGLLAKRKEKGRPCDGVNHGSQLKIGMQDKGASSD